MFFIETLTSQSTNREFDNANDAIIYIRWALESNFKPNEIIVNGKSLERIIVETATWRDQPKPGHWFDTNTNGFNNGEST